MWHKTSGAAAGRGGRWSSARWWDAAGIQSPSSNHLKVNLGFFFKFKIENVHVTYMLHLFLQYNVLPYKHTTNSNVFINVILYYTVLGSLYIRLQDSIKYWDSSVSVSKSILSGINSTLSWANSSNCRSIRHTLNRKNEKNEKAKFMNLCIKRIIMK